MSAEPAVDQEARQKARREQLLERDYMPAFRSPRPPEYDRFQSERKERTTSPYALPPKHNHESSYLSSYKPVHLREMYSSLSAVQPVVQLVGHRPQIARSKPQLDNDDGESKGRESHPAGTDASFRGLAYLPEPPKTRSAQFFRRRASHIAPSSGSRHRHITDEFTSHAMATRWQSAAETREPLLARLGYPFDKGFVVMVHREHCTAFVEVSPGMTPRQLVNRMRNEPPPGTPFNRLRMGQYLGVPCFARLIRGPYILAEDRPLSAQNVGPNCNLALVFKERLGTFDLIDQVLGEEQRSQAETVTKHFSRREEHNWGWIGQPDPQVVAQAWFQELLQEQKRVAGANVLLHAALGLRALHETQSAATGTSKTKQNKRKDKTPK